MPQASKAQRINKAEPSTLYVRRNVENADEIIAWAKGQGFKTTLPADDMHVTIAFSKAKVDWMKISAPTSYMEDDNGNLLVRSSPVRVVQALGPKGAVVLMFNDYYLSARHEDIKRVGATWDHPEYQPHITITYEPGDVDLGKVEPYRGEILLGQEIFEPINENWSAGVTEKFSKATVAKVDEELGLVLGWAIVCSEDGEDYYDLQGDHIPEHSMLSATADFMASSRLAKEMHVGDGKGTILFAWPMTTDIAKAMGITCKRSGLMIAMKPDNPEMLAKFRDGTYTGFSIGGLRVEDEEVADAA